MPISHKNGIQQAQPVVEQPCNFGRNNPYDRAAPIQLVIPKLPESKQVMDSIREFRVPENAFAIWYLGQNGFILKDTSGPLIGIDLYLTNSCASTYAHLSYRLDRQLPVFIEPEDLDIDVFITTHSHQDHADPETLRRMKKSATIFVGPFDSWRLYRECGVPGESCRLIHPGEILRLEGSTTVQATFALPTDATDLNHAGMLVRFANGTFITRRTTIASAYCRQMSMFVPYASTAVSIISRPLRQQPSSRQYGRGSCYRATTT